MLASPPHTPCPPAWSVKAGLGAASRQIELIRTARGDRDTLPQVAEHPARPQVGTRLRTHAGNALDQRKCIHGHFLLGSCGQAAGVWDDPGSAAPLGAHRKSRAATPLHRCSARGPAGNLVVERSAAMQAHPPQQGAALHQSRAAACSPAPFFLQRVATSANCCASDNQGAPEARHR